MRLTDRNRRNQAARRQAEALIQREIYKQLRWLWWRLYPHLQRWQRERPGKHLNKRQALRMRKQEFTDVDRLWGEFRRRLEAVLTARFADAAELLAAVDRAYWADHDLTLTPTDIVNAYRDQIGLLITRVSADTRAWTGNQIAEWYQTPGSTFQQLINTLAPQYGTRRAALIGTNEITGLDSIIQRGVMEQVGASRWWWQTMRDEVVCVHELEGPDGAIYAGCRDLQGHEFGLDEADMMPPDGSHIGCRCSAVIKVSTAEPIPIPVGPQASTQPGPGFVAEAVPGTLDWIGQQGDELYDQAWLSADDEE